MAKTILKEKKIKNAIKCRMGQGGEKHELEAQCVVQAHGPGPGSPIVNVFGQGVQQGKAERENGICAWA